MRQIRSRTFMTDRGGVGVCPRCYKRIDEGDIVLFHRSHGDTPVHAGCRGPREPREPIVRRRVKKPKRIPLCAACRLEHRGSCI